jgi:uncharacterized protein (TIGR02598 family)
MTINWTIKTCPDRSEAGFSIVEGTVAMGIIGVLFVALLAGFTSGFSVIRLARENVRATQILQEKMETVRLFNWDQINTAGFIPTSFTNSFDPTNSSKGVIYRGTVTITNAPLTEIYTNKIRQVIVDLNWTSGTVNRSRRMTTLVSRNGLQNYIY